MPTTERRSDLVARFMQAESEGAIKQWYYSYAPDNTTQDRRYVFDPGNGQGTTVLLHREVPGFLTGLGY